MTLTTVRHIPIRHVSHNASTTGSITPLCIILFLPKVHIISLLPFEVALIIDHNSNDKMYFGDDADYTWMRLTEFHHHT